MSLTVATNATKKPPVPAYHSPLVQITVGSEATDFNIHRDLLCHYSMYFRTAIMSDFVEAKTLHFTMVEEKPAVLKCFERFLYTGELFDEDQNNGTTSQAESDVANYGSEHGCDENSRQTKQTFLVELWVFGDRRGVPALQDQAITALYREMCRQQEVSTHAIMTAYENTLRGTALRAFFTEHFVHLTNFSFARNTNLFHQEFLADICDKATLLLHQKTTSKAAVQHKIDVSDFFVSDCGGRITFPGMYAARRSDDHDRQPSSRAPSPDTKRAHASTAAKPTPSPAWVRAAVFGPIS